MKKPALVERGDSDGNASGASHLAFLVPYPESQSWHYVQLSFIRNFRDPGSVSRYLISYHTHNVMSTLVRAFLQRFAFFIPLAQVQLPPLF